MANEQDHDHSAKARTMTGRILVADDEDLTRYVLVRVLQRMGFEVDEACNGVEALEAAKAGAHSLMFLDVNMPQLNGLDTARAIRTLPGKAGSVPIIGVSGVALITEVDCRVAGMNGFIRKPLGLDEYRNAATKWTGEADAA